MQCAGCGVLPAGPVRPAGPAAGLAAAPPPVRVLPGAPRHRPGGTAAAPAITQTQCSNSSARTTVLTF